MAAALAPKPASAGAPPPATVGAASTPQRRAYNPAFPASSPDLAAADEAQAAASSAGRARAAAKPAAAAAGSGGRETWPAGTAAAVKAALPIGMDGTIVPLAEPRVTATVLPAKGSIYYSGGTISMRDVPPTAVAVGGNATAADPVAPATRPDAVATGG